MGNLLGGVGLREPTTVEDCDSTWQTDSEPESEPEPEEPEPGPGGGAGPERESEPEPEAEERGGPARDADAEAAGAGQVGGGSQCGPHAGRGSWDRGSEDAGSWEPAWAWPRALREVPPAEPNLHGCLLRLCGAAG